MNPRNDWQATMQTLSGLYPEFNPTPEERKLWRDQFERMNQEYVQEAIRRMRTKYTSKRPEIPWMHRFIEEIKAERAVAKGEVSEDERKRREAEEQAFYASEQRAMLDDLERCDDDLLEAGRDMLRDSAFAKSICFGEENHRNESNNPNDWSWAFVGFMWAAICGPKATVTVRPCAATA